MPTNSQAVAPIVEVSPYWHGMLCAETCDEIAGRMAGLLQDNYFSLVICNSYDENSDRFHAVDVHPSQWLRDGVHVRTYGDERAGISWGTPGYVMGVSSTAGTQREARQGNRLQYVYFTFERDRVEIDHYAPAGYRLRWIFAVERHDRED